MASADESYGHVLLKLEEVRVSKNISKSKLAYRAEMGRSQINYYITGKIQRPDLSIIARLCYALDCTVADLLEYVPPEK